MQDTTKKKIIKWFWVIFCLPFVLVGLLILFVWAFTDIPSFEELEHPENKLATQVIASGGEILATFHLENRSYVMFSELDPSVVQAAVATEDVRFYQHSGIDFKSLGRVLVKTLMMSDSSQGGGSTITQQLAKNLYKREEFTTRIPGGYKARMVVIKIREWITAVKIERNYTKDEIITMYLNTVFFGSNSYGVKAAAQTFFSKIPAELTVEESAMLVGMVNKPTRYNPTLNPDQALGRRNFVLSRMEQAGYITKAQRDSIQQIPITLSYHEMDHNSGRAPYFRDMLYRVMSAKQPQRSDYNSSTFSSDSLRNASYYEYRADSIRWVNDPLYGWLEKNRKPDGSKHDIYTEGLKIYTSIDYTLQGYAEEALAEHLSGELQPAFWKELRYRSRPPFANSVKPEVVERLMKQARRWSDRYRMMKKSGHSESEIMKSFDVPVRMRLFSWNKKGYVDTLMTPNDSIIYYKSHIRAAFMAIEPHTGLVKAYVGGPNYRYFKYDNVSQARRQVGSTIKPFLYTLAMLNELTPCTLLPNQPASFGNWSPRGTDGSEIPLSLRSGLTASSNYMSSQLMKLFGPEAMVDVMRTMGIKTYIEPVPALCVGAADVAVCEMVAAYNTFPSEGLFIEPLFVTRIEDNSGNVLATFHARKKEALDKKTAYTMISMMESVVNSGTGSRLRYRYGLKGDIAGKTGTTNDNSDGWFIGYTPTITCGAWVGCEDRQAHFMSGSTGQGASQALPIVGLFLKKAMANGTLGITSNDYFTLPAGVSIPCDRGDFVSRSYTGDITEEEAEQEMFFE